MRLVKRSIPYLKEEIWQGVLDNGLTVYLLPKPDFYETYGLLTVDFGAIDTCVKLKNQKKTSFPLGIAHFLEHKLFEEKDGGDAMDRFAQLGASANAFTGFRQTAYLFSTSQRVKEALTLLQTFVREPSFSQESVVREQDIIAQEIDMYLDDPDYRLYAGILASLYPQTPLACDIAGTGESIRTIDAAALYENHRLFYRPDQMSLFVVGRFDPEEIVASIQQTQASLPALERQQVVSLPLEKHPVLTHQRLYEEVASPKVALGLRGNDSLVSSQLASYQICLQLLFSMLMGWTSTRYQTLYEKGKIDSSFHVEVEVSAAYHFVLIFSDTREPIHLSTTLKKAILQFEEDSDVTSEHLDLLKKEWYGDFIKQFNSLEATAQAFLFYRSLGLDLLDVPALLEAIDLETVLSVGRQFISSCDWADFTILPK